MKNLLIFDIDGTLLSEKTGIVPQSAIDALKKAQANGDLIYINTGRPITAIPKEITDLDVDGYICGCGSYISYKDEILFHTPVSNYRCKQIVNVLVETKTPAILEGANGLYYDRNNQSDKIKMIMDYYDKQNFSHKYWDEDDIIFDKLTAFLDDNSDESLFLNLIGRFFDVIKRGPKFYECQPRFLSKATGIQFLMGYFHIDMDHVYAFGDSTNDLSMLEYVKNSIGMANGDLIVLDRVSYVTDDVDKDGIYHAMKHFGIID